MNRAMTREEFVKKYPDAILLEQITEDWYKCYYGADKCHKCIGLSIHNDGADYVAFSSHALDIYLPKLVRAGYRIAIINI